ncbi:MAG: hypothetical protein JSS49_14095 [Planctomycetes bacterium]|nr:hypothetical protein [Planctomycetota bacterium]
MNRITRRTSSRVQQPARSGSTLLIVVALMGMLAFLGFVFYTFSAQERANALALAEGAKVRTAPSIEPDALWDFALQQIILGPHDSNFQSILWGGRHSLLPNMYGRDSIPYNGEGVHLGNNGGVPFVDMDYDGSLAITALGTAENVNLLNVIDSPAANNGIQWGAGKSIWLGGAFNPTTTNYIPEPDVNYSSPNIDSMFLSYDGIATDAAGNQKRVIIPSYMRPQYLRKVAGTADSQWYNSKDANGNNYPSMRPHPSHVCLDSSGNVLNFQGTSTPIPRYFSSADASNGLPPYNTYVRKPFTSVTNPVNQFAPSESINTNSPTVGTLGVWTNNSTSPFDIDLDVDTDGDGIMDSILMDLGYPPVRRGDGKLVIPLFAINIRDLNGLLNLNATGNLAGNNNTATLQVTGPSGGYLGYRATGAGVYTPDNLSKSNQGTSTYEINPQRALTADPFYNPLTMNYNDNALGYSEAAAQVAYALQLFDPSVTASNPTQAGRSVVELANIEWLMLNMGRAQFHVGLANSGALQNAITDIFAGRNGEYLDQRSYLADYGNSGTLYMPRPGQSARFFPTYGWGPTLTDDNANGNEGEANYNTRWVHPVDFSGAGIQFRRFGFGPDGHPGVVGVDDDGNGLIDDPLEAGWSGSDDAVAYGTQAVQYPMMFTASGSLLWPSYSGYQNYGQTIRWGEFVSTGSNSTKLMTSASAGQLLDDPTETVVDPVVMSPSYSGSTYVATNGSSITNAVNNDMVFGPQEMSFLQGSNRDSRQADVRSRLADLMPANLVASSNAAEIRKRLTTVSTDRREFALTTYPVGQLRTNSSGATTPYVSWESFPQFPPDATYSSNPNPYRNELFYYLQQAWGGSTGQSTKLEVNRLLFLNSAATQFGFCPLPEQTSVSDQSATTARQYMARDIYTLLYTLCQGSDLDYRTNPTPPTPRQAREMAQFAVNLVDALDSDDIITAFYYDNDLSQSGGGWTTAAATDVVYGVERQLLALTEVMGFRVSKTNTDSPMTIFDDTQTDANNGRRYLYFELQNVTPLPVKLASASSTRANVNVATGSGGDWRISLYSADVAAKTTTLLNRMVLLSGLSAVNNVNSQTTVQVDASNNVVLTGGALFTVSSQDGTDKIGPDYRTSDFRADTNVDGSYERFAPSGGAPDTESGKVVPSSGTAITQFPIPKCNLDLVWNYGDGAASPTRFVLQSNDGTPGGFVTGITSGGSPINTLQIVLERRVADGNATPTSWVVVDRSPYFTVGTITPPEAPPAVMASDVTNALKTINSYPRTTAISYSSTDIPMPGANSLNTQSPTTGTQWQWQPDRAFTSLAELMLIPMYGPDSLTDGRLGNREFVDRTNLNIPFAGDPLYPTATNANYIPTIASARFLRPDNPDQTSQSNRWYRLFQFLEVPNRAHQHPAIAGITNTSVINWGSLGMYGVPATFTNPGTPGTTSNTTIPLSPVTGLDNFPLTEPFNLPLFYGWPRVHGQVNLNMISSPQVLLALLDNDQLVRDPRYGVGSQFLDSADGDPSNRQWWIEFLKARESNINWGFNVDPITGLYVPGTATSRPFRGFDALGGVAASSLSNSPLEDTVLRSLPLDSTSSSNPNENRRLWEVGFNNAEHFGKPMNESNTSNTVLHPAARYQLMSKLMNNTTTRTNSYAVYITAQYHEVAEIPSDSGVSAFRIGGKLDDAPIHRGFFVIDRTGAVEQMKILSANAVNPVSTSTYRFAPNTDKTGKRFNMNGIRWKDLVLYRQTLN